ncbi:MAG: ATP-binding cassette domain-containing protein, partial [Curvibacter sp.]|nr:ATP-binding cassette domain-containing protein [Curvibacter sp.]
KVAGVPAAEIAQRVDALLALVGLEGKQHVYPGRLSGGQKQRVGIARALATRPQILLCDEATSALDPETTQSILALLRDINRRLGITIVLITHEMQVIKQVADRVAVMEAGRVVESGPVLEVFSRPQQAITRSLIEDVVPQSLPEAVLSRLRGRLTSLSVGSFRLLRLVFAGPQGERPLLSDLVRRFGLDLNIVHGQVDEVQGQTFGALTVLLQGAADALSDAVAHLNAAGVAVEELSHV